MKKLLLISVFIILTFSLFSKSVNALSPLHTEGRYIMDENSNIVILHGVHYGTHINVPAGGWVPEGATNDEPWGHTTWNPDAIQYNLDKMAEYGINALRIHLPTLERWYRNNVEAGGINAPTVRDEIHYVIQEAEKRGIYVILCPWTLAYTGPGEQTAIPFDYYNDSEGKYGPPGTYGNFTYGAQVGIHQTPEDFIDYWVGDVNSLYTEYGNYTNVIYELWNEANGWVSGWDLERAYFDVCQEIVNRLRAKGDEHLVIYSFGYSGYLSNMAMDRGLVLNGTNIVYNIHAYRIHNGAQPPDQIPYSWHWRDAAHEYSDVEARYLLTGLYGPASERGYYVQNVIDRNLPLINGEFGYHSQGADLELQLYDEDWEAMWFYNTMKFLQDLGYGYTAFQWKHAGMIFTPFEDCNEDNPWLPPLNRGGLMLIKAIQEAIGDYPVNITGIVTDSETASPIEQATVSCNIYAGITNSTGEYKIGMPSTGYCDLTASKSGYTTNSTFLSFPINGTYSQDFVLDPIKINVAGKLIDKNNNPIQTDITIYQEGKENVVATNQTVDGDYTLILPADTYDIQFNISNFFIKLLSVDVISDITDIINYVNYSSDKLSFISNIDNQEFQILTPFPTRVLLNNSKIANSSLPLNDNTYYYNPLTNVLHLKTTPDLKSDCIYECCEDEERYRDKPCVSGYYCSNKVCYAKITCPYECCVGEETYIDKQCPPEQGCSNNICLPSTTFGKVDIGGSSTPIYQHNIAGSKFPLSIDGTVTGISVYLTSTGSGSKEYSAMIYDSSLNFVARSRQSLALPLSGWYNFTFSQGLTGGDYWLFVWGEAGIPSTFIYYDAGTSNQYGLRYQTYDGASDPISSWDIQEDYSMSIYATYTIS